jgi:hypothetical protein
MTKHRIRDQFLYGLLAVVFAAVAVIIFRGSIPGLEFRPEVKQEVFDAQTPDELMQELQSTVDDGGNSDIQRLKGDAKGL